MKASGFEVGEVSTAAATAKSVVSYGVGAKAVAEALAEQLGVAAVPNEQTAAESVSVLIGEDNAQTVFSAAPAQSDSSVSAGTVPDTGRSEEHTSALQYLMRISYAVFCLKKKNSKEQKILQ